MATIAENIATAEQTMADLVASKPSVVDGHSDGKRVRYVRAETAVHVLRDLSRTDEQRIRNALDLLNGIVADDLRSVTERERVGLADVLARIADGTL